MTRTYDRERVLLADAFNAEYYLQELPEISHESLDPLVHYLEQGWRDLLDPSPHFSTSFYLEAHPDVREQGVNPLLHYVESGRAEGRITRETSKRYAYERTIIASAFDIEYYLTQLPELRNSTVDPIIHYLQKGWQELRDPSADFSTSYYLQAHPDVREQGV